MDPNQPNQGMLTPPPTGGPPAASPAGAMPPAGGAPPAGGTPPSPQGKQPVASSLDTRDYEQNPPNEKDQETVEKLSINAVRLIHDPKAKESLLKVITTAEHPIQGVSNAINQILRRLEQQETKDGGKMNDFTRLSTGLVIASEIMEMSEAAGVTKEFTEDEKQVALGQAVQDYMSEEINTGRRQSGDVQAQAGMAEKRYAEMNTDPMGQPVAGNNDPFNPGETMSQKLGKGGML
jgi:hypothetical protein